MSNVKYIRIYLTAVLLIPLTFTSAQNAAAQRDGKHDFDFLNGSWTFHLKRQLNAMTDSASWTEYNGTANVHSFMGGLAQLSIIEGSDTKTHKPIEGATLRLYDRSTQLWRLYLLNTNNGTVLLPPEVGSFDSSGRGEFYDFEVFRAHPILVRYLWTHNASDSVHFEQAFSADQGKTWKTNWIYAGTRSVKKEK